MCEDIHENAKRFKTPTLVCLAGKDYTVHNGASRTFIKNARIPKTDLFVKEYPNSYHNLHKEPEYKASNLADTYEFMHGQLSKTCLKFDTKDLNTLRFGRAKKKKSFKVKRTIAYFIISNYLIVGFLMALMRILTRQANLEPKLTNWDILYTVMEWPRVLWLVFLRYSYIYFKYYGFEVG